MDIVDGADLKSVLLVDRVGLRGEEDHRNIAGDGIGLQAPADLIAVHARHHHVEQDEVRLLGGGSEHQRLLAIGRDLGPIRAFEHAGDHPDIGRGVVDDQNELVVVGHLRLKDRRSAIDDRHFSAEFEIEIADELAQRFDLRRRQHAGQLRSCVDHEVGGLAVVGFKQALELGQGLDHRGWVAR